MDLWLDCSNVCFVLPTAILNQAGRISYCKQCHHSPRISSGGESSAIYPVQPRAPCS